MTTLVCVFTDLVKLIEKTVKSENHSFPKRPIYLVGESIGACLALDVAARNPNIDLALILANPGTNLHRSVRFSYIAGKRYNVYVSFCSQ